jgi:FAD synthetase
VIAEMIFMCVGFRFTSLGSMENTHPNPDLLLDGECFRPAFMLANEAHERFGRIGSSKK